MWSPVWAGPVEPALRTTGHAVALTHLRLSLAHQVLQVAARADKRELVVLAWKGGVEEKLKIEKQPGTLKYLATWQGLRGEDLDIALEDEQVIVCSKTGQIVAFSAKLPVEEE